MKRNAEKEKFWREMMGEAERSGKSVRSFCQERDLNENQFYSWRRELRVRDAEEGEHPGFVELVPTVSTNASAGVSLKIDERISIVLERGFDAGTLMTALAALGVADAT